MCTFTTFSNSNNRYNILEVEGEKKPDILILGDGDFSFTEALVNRRMQGIGLTSPRKYPDFASPVLATEYMNQEQCLAGAQTLNRVKSLHNLGVTFNFGIDAGKIDKTYAGRTFTRIQWNCPDLNGPFCDQASELRNTIIEFVLASSNLQKSGGKLHISLISPKTLPDHRTWQAMHYGITAVEGNGYVLHSIKTSGSDRYAFPDSKGELKSWSHQKTSGNETVSAFEEGVKEFVFKRVINPVTRTPAKYINNITGYRKLFPPDDMDWEDNPPEKIRCTEKYYSMTPQDPLSSDSEYENESEGFN